MRGLVEFERGFREFWFQRFGHGERIRIER